jgi:hypothetical protein
MCLNPLGNARDDFGPLADDLRGVRLRLLPRRRPERRVVDGNRLTRRTADGRGTRTRPLHAPVSLRG